MNYLDEALAQTVTVMWDSVLGTELLPVDHTSVPANDHGLVGCIHVTGPDGGVVTIECSSALARAAACTMFNILPTTVGEADAEDSLGELANIVGGNFKGLLGPGHQLSLPKVVEGRDFRTRFIGTQLASRVSFSNLGEPLTVSFFREGARAGGALAGVS